MGDAQIGGSEFSASTATKAAIFRAGGGTLVLAIAMLEDKTLLCDYNFGDNKEGDAANFGIYKMNWYMIRQCASAIALIGNRMGPDVWRNTGPAINADTALATQILLEAMDKWSIDAPDPNNPVSENFWAGHRWGETGLRNLAGTDWNDILHYYRAVKAIEASAMQIQPFGLRAFATGWTYRPSESAGSRRGLARGFRGRPRCLSFGFPTGAECR